MKNLKQTRLSFAPITKTDTPTTLSHRSSASTSVPVSEESPTKTPKPKTVAQSSDGRSRSHALDCVEIPPPPKRTSRAKSLATSTPLRSSPRKRAAALSSAQSRKPSLKRKFSPGPDSASEDASNVVHVSRTSESTYFTKNKPKASASSLPPRKIRLSSPESDLTPLPTSSLDGTDPDELVPTSQSDEQELTFTQIPKKDPAAVTESVDQWRKETHANYPIRTESPPPIDPIRTSLNGVDDMRMDVDYGLQDESFRNSIQPVGYPHTPRSMSGGSSRQLHLDAATAIVTRASALQTTVPQNDTPTRARPSAVPMTLPSDAFSSLTPPSSDPISPLEAEEETQVVQALDVKSKTEQIIADIKTRAFAAAHSSPEQSPLGLDAFSDSDSESDGSNDNTATRGGLVAAFSRGTNKDKAGPSTESASAPRYNLRRVSPKSAKPALPLATQHRKPRKTDPLEVLLRQKAREERTGTGMAAIRSAEAAYASSVAREEAKKGLMDEVDDEEASDNEEDWQTGLAMLRAAARGSKGKNRTSATSKGKRSVMNSDDEDLESADDEAIPDSQRRDAVGKILESDLRDKKAKELAQSSEEPVGVPLWSMIADGAEDKKGMNVDPSLPRWVVDTGGNPMLELLRTAVDNNDVVQVSALLSAGLVASLQPEHVQHIIPWLFDVDHALAFSDVDPSATCLAYTQLIRMRSMLEVHPSGLRPSSVLSALIRLGAQQSLLEQHGWDVPAEQPSQFVFDGEWREEMVHRLVSLLAVLTHVSMANELLDFFLIMILVGMDPSTSDDLLIEVRKSCDSIAHVIEAAQGDAFELEASLCEKLVAFGKTLPPASQERLISLLPCTAPSTVRLSRNVARSFLMDLQLSPGLYEKLPDLSPVVNLLAPSPGSGGYFDVVGNSNQDGFYDALTCRVSLLNRVMSDIDDYTMQEIQAAKEHAAREKERLAKEKAQGAANDMEEKQVEEQEPPVERIRRLLEELHGKIFDTKAAHLDRSRAKAALQKLALRVHYQRMATLRSGTGKPRTLHRYFPGRLGKP
ncbi:hypothetical protein BN946_scf185042.g108 [Trametes cinnabarina]|uniref:Uncharacterized protein n=1 Tax=Pycnoporus cinnabarinus TaxID=5643 RepID=A0A060S4T3_PYCCI|nr:hypothetical protein BN946_scf185042.g108 [Trametes cinnabarina]